MACQKFWLSVLIQRPFASLCTPPSGLSLAIAGFSPPCNIVYILCVALCFYSICVSSSVLPANILLLSAICMVVIAINVCLHSSSYDICLHCSVMLLPNVPLRDN